MTKKTRAHRWLSIGLAVVGAWLLAAPAALAQWNPAKPADADQLVAPPIRANWAAIEKTLGGVNLLADPTFLIWPAGDAAVPAHWTLTGSPTPARIGTGLGDTLRKVGAFALKITAGGATGSARQNILASGSYDDGFDGLVFSFGSWVYAVAGSACRIGIGDGIGTTYSSDHTGNSTWQWLTGTRVVDATANQVYYTQEASASQVCRFSGPVVLFGETPPKYFQAPPTTVLPHRCFIAGVQTTGTRKIGTGCDFYFTRPAIVKDVYLSFTTAVPTGATFLVDVNHYDGAAFQSMFSTRPQVAAGSATGSPAAPDGTYRYRCFQARTGTTQTDSLMTVDVDQIGSGAAGTDLTVEIRYMIFARPLEAFLTGISVN